MDKQYQKKINLHQTFDLFEDLWTPRIIGELNGQVVKIAKIKGEFIWHAHEKEDELFLVIKGKVLIKLRDKEIKLNEGEMLIVPHGIEHKPVAEEEAHILMFEPLSTLNTGNVLNEHTVEETERI
jgi:mannose-6-phosphate isomerase-like protein (cupin superfamily)